MAKRRKRGEGSVHLRKDGRWEGRVVVGYDDKGLPITKNVLAKTKSECTAKLKKLQETCAKKPNERLQPDMTFGQWMDFWYQNYSKPKLRPTTQEGYENAIYKHIIPALGKIPLSELNTNEIQQFYAKLKKEGRLIRTALYGEGVSDRTVWSCHTRIRTALDRAVQDGLIRTNPAADCKLPPQNTKEMKILSREEMQRFLIQAKEEGYFELFLLELATGLRRGEVLALQWGDLDFNTGALHIQRQIYRANGKLVVSEPKTKAALRSIVLPPSLVEVLKEYQQGMTSHWMFPSPAKEDSPLDPATVRKRLQTILNHAGCKQVRFHDLRHLFVTTSLESGMDVKTLSTIIGHVSAKTTLNIYTHVTDAMRQTAAAKIDRSIGKREPQGKTCSDDGELPTQTPKTYPEAAFEPYKGKNRKRGTGCLTQINDHLWEGRYSPRWPDGKIHSRNVYATTSEECEVKLTELIQQMKLEIAEAKHLAAEGKWEEAMALAGQKKARGIRDNASNV
ncbi:MAG: site-specific integrase [Clostridiales bacterium]|nr:site-specific integrase [Clostridiales bacterium]